MTNKERYALKESRMLKGEILPIVKRLNRSFNITNNNNNNFSIDTLHLTAGLIPFQLDWQTLKADSVI